MMMIYCLKQIRMMIMTPKYLINNIKLIIKYPFIKIPGTVSRTWLDELPYGWRIAFGEKLLQDLKRAIKLDNCRRTFYWLTIKEKYGTLRLYAGGYGNNTEKVIEKYELLSQCYCIDCGAPARYVTPGYVTYICGKCAIKNADLYGKSKPIRLTKEHIPVLYNYHNDDKILVDIKKEYDIDFEKMWNLY